MHFWRDMADEKLVDGYLLVHSGRRMKDWDRPDQGRMIFWAADVIRGKRLPTAMMIEELETVGEELWFDGFPTIANAVAEAVRRMREIYGDENGIE